MPLTLQDNNLTGIYQGQGGNAVPIGTGISGKPDGDPDSPFIVGAYTGGDSIQMNIFFDPSVSKKAVPFLFEKIGIIQLGNFRLNYLDLPLGFYQADNLNPDTVKYTGKWPGATHWIDVCWGKSDNTQNDDPMFPAWNYATYARTSQKKLFQYPNDFGGYVRYNRTTPIQYKNGENLCAYITSNIEMDSGNSPLFETKLSLMQFIDGIDPANYVLEDSGVNAVNFQTNIEQFPNVINALYERNIIPFDYNLTFSYKDYHHSLSRNYSIRYVITPTRIYISSYNKLFPSDDDVPQRMVLVPQNGTFHYFYYSDDFDGDFETATKASQPDIPKILDNVRKQYGLSLLKTSELLLTYEMYTCACAILQAPDNITKSVVLQLFEGFRWDVTNKYTEANQWDNLELTQIPLAGDWLCTARRFSLKFALTNYYKKIYGNDFRVTIYD